MSGEQTELRIDLAILAAKEALTAIAKLEERVYQLENPPEEWEETVKRRREGK